MNVMKTIKAILDRNKRVELDKAWETSWTRKILISVFTYIVVVIFFIFADLSRPFINSIVPSLAFIISTLGLNFFKKIWIRRRI